VHELPPDDHDEEAAQRRSMLMMIAAAFAVVLVGGWLAYAMHDYLAKEQCRAEGHHYCDGPPIETSR
jgi:heme/copper-type cytochrome/quinol oxidase subunit 2